MALTETLTTYTRLQQKTSFLSCAHLKIWAQREATKKETWKKSLKHPPLVMGIEINKLLFGQNLFNIFVFGNYVSWLIRKAPSGVIKGGRVVTKLSLFGRNFRWKKSSRLSFLLKGLDENVAPKMWCNLILKCASVPFQSSLPMAVCSQQIRRTDGKEQRRRKNVAWHEQLRKANHT